MTSDDVVIYASLGVAVVALLLAGWLLIQVTALGKRLAAVPKDGDVVAYLSELDHDLGSLETAMTAMQPRLASVEARMPQSLSRVGVVTYDAFGNIAGNMSRSAAMLDEMGSGLVFTVLVGRSETMFYTKQVKDGHGLEELSPEEQASVSKALAG